MKSSPTYPLETVKELVGKGRWRATVIARDTALEMGFDDEDISDCIRNHLADSHFYKTMPAEKRPGFMQDVYRITYGGWPIYLKLQIADEFTVVISFKAE